MQVSRFNHLPPASPLRRLGRRARRHEPPRAAALPAVQLAISLLPAPHPGGLTLAQLGAREAERARPTRLPVPRRLLAPLGPPALRPRPLLLPRVARG